jgi:hypothetical protein
MLTMNALKYKENVYQADAVLYLLSHIFLQHPAKPRNLPWDRFFYIYGLSANRLPALQIIGLVNET